MSSNPGRLLRTVRHLKPAQVWHRSRLTARRWIWERTCPIVDARYRARASALGPAQWSSEGLGNLVALRRGRRDEAERQRIADDALVGRFTFLERSEDLGAHVAWQREDLDAGTRLWKTMLHEHPYAEDLAFSFEASRDDAYARRFWELVDAWAAVHPVGCRDFARDVWNARAVANRMLSWSVAAYVLGPAARLDHHLAVHALFLRDNVEWDLGGNHVIRDMVGLALASVLFSAYMSRDEILALLEREVAEQVLDDGCHVERSPMYHAIVLRDLVEVRALLATGVPAWLDDAIARMAGFLVAVRHGDGELALFGDCWFGEIDSARVLEEVGDEPPRATGGAVSGLAVLHAGDAKLIVRAGEHGPDHQLGHAHADLLSFELSRGSTRIITDTGTGTYDAGPQRALTRSTAAHNTLQLDGVEQLEAWSSFRVGRRGRARIVRRGETWLWCAHDAYRHLEGNPEHHRLLWLTPRSLVVLDAVLGRGSHTVVSRLHRHPDDRTARIESLGGKAVASTALLYEHFGGEGRDHPVSTMTEHATLPWVGGWLVLFDPPSHDTEAPRWEAGEDGVEVRYDAPGLALEARWHPRRESDPTAVQLSMRG